MREGLAPISIFSIVLSVGCAADGGQPNTSDEAFAPSTEQSTQVDSCSPRRVVRAFLNDLDTLDPAVWVSYFADDHAPGGPACYSNTGVKNPRGEVGGCYLGKAEISQFLGAFLPLLSTFDAQVLSMAVDGPVVLVRRIDNHTVSPLAGQIFPDAKVGANFDLQVMGAFTVRNCKITSWSEYFNTGDWEAASGIPLPK
jgi:limonene-1,2-epoxide hydrolase